MNPPIAVKIKTELTEHGNTRTDNYFWLNQIDNPKVLEYLIAENDYADEILKHTEALQEKIYNEIIGRIKQDDTSVPYRDNGYFYYTRYEGEGNILFTAAKRGQLILRKKYSLM